MRRVREEIERQQEEEYRQRQDEGDSYDQQIRVSTLHSPHSTAGKEALYNRKSLCLYYFFS